MTERNGIPPTIAKLITLELKKEARAGETTKDRVLLRVMQKVETGNGQRTYGLSPALIHGAVRHLLAQELDRQLKTKMPDNVIDRAFHNAPPELAKMLHKLPAWISTSEGSSARWVPSLMADYSDWMKHAALKHKKADQTRGRANEAEDIARYLSTYGIRSLADMMVGVAAAE